MEEILGNDPARLQGRKRWMSLLAHADFDILKKASLLVSDWPKFSFKVLPTTGLVMLSGMMGGKGALFSVGEATVTRCLVLDACGFTGVAYILGRNRQHAEIAARLDAMLQNPDKEELIRNAVIARLEKVELEIRSAHEKDLRKTEIHFSAMKTMRS